MPHSTFYCKQCDTPFYRSYTNGTTPVYCSRKCRDNARIGKVMRVPLPVPTHTCQQCGTTFQKAKRGKKDWPPKYCSRKCTKLAFTGVPLGPRKLPIPSTCLNCGNPVVDYPCRGARQFCSIICQIAYAYTTNICEHCQREFSVMKSRKHRHFCSRDCYWQHKTGANNGNWKGGYNPFYYGPDWPKISEQARQRDGYQCQRCGLPQSKCYRALDVHHIRPYTSFGHQEFEKANELDNLITLCHPCHMAVEGKPIARPQAAQ